MNRSITPLILIVIAIGVYFTYTRVKIDEIQSIRAVNLVYQQALDNSEKLVKKRDEVLANYNKIDIEDRDRLEKILPDNIDNVRLIIDTNAVAAKYGLVVKNIKTSSTAVNSDNKSAPVSPTAQFQTPTDVSRQAYNTMTLTFSVASNYETFTEFLKALEASLRVMEVSKITLSVGDKGAYDYSVEMKTYWIKQ